MTALRNYVAGLALPWEGMYADVWTISHTLFGFVCSYATRRAGLSARSGLLATLGAAVLWEIGERITGIARLEALTNSAMDVVVALVGYGVGVWFMERYEPRERAMAAPVVAIAVIIAIFLIRQLDY